jgi:hypothetical protein
LYYRVRITDLTLGCAQPNSAAVSVQVFNDATIAINTSAAEVCLDGIANLTATVNGGSFARTYHWQTSPDGSTGWTDVGVANGPFSAPTSAVGLFYYRARIDDPVAGCDDPVSNVVTVLVSPDAQVDVDVDNAEVCVGGTALLNADVTGGSTSLSIQWQSSATLMGTYSDIIGATSAIYSAPTLATGTVYYRIRVIESNNGCATPNSDTVSVTVVPDALISASVNNAQICVDGTALLTASLTGGSSAATLQWQYSSTSVGPYIFISFAF